MLTFEAQVAITRPDETSQIEALEDVGVSVGSKTSRGRLLELLEQHVIRKKSRLSSKCSETRLDAHRKSQGTTTKATRQITTERAHEDQPSTTVHESPRQQDPNFELFTDQQLQQMVQGVGLDTNGMPRSDLVKACKTYHQLSEWMLRYVQY